MTISEFDLIYRYLANFGAGENVSLGAGDDAAVLTLPAGSELLVSTDTQVEGRHFLPDSLPEHVAYRAVAAAASDLAAMGARPLAMTLALTLPDNDELWLHSFSMGLAKAVEALNLPLVGGDLTRGPLALTVTVMGHSKAGEWIPRTGARPGDRVCVTGSLGDAAAALALLNGELALSGDPEDPALSPSACDYLESRFFAPSVRFEYASWLVENAHAAIDISDGLLADLAHIAHASGLACHIDPDAIPLSAVLKSLPREQALSWALTGGDDYELAMTVPPGVALPPGVTVVGECVAGSGVHCPGFEGLAGGFDHFASAGDAT